MVPHPWIAGTPLSHGQMTAVAERNAALMHYYQQAERDYYRPSVDHREPHGLPRLCVSLSGGGLRSAAFSVGVLKALHRLGILEHVDVISAVSGGSFAASWFYAQQIIHDIGPADLFGEHGSGPTTYEQELCSSAAALTPTARDTGAKVGRLAGGAIGQAIITPLYALFMPLRWLLGREAPMSILHSLYKGQLQGIFHAYRRIDLGKVERVVRARGLPLPIINLTARPYGQAPGAVSITDGFEISPLRYGSERFGYAVGTPPIRLDEAIAMSGAALRKILGTTVPFVPGRLRGRSVVDSPEGARFVALRLEDGAFADNLGLATLIKRLCGRIVVVDAEHDPFLKFEAYSKLVHELPAVMGARIIVPGIDALVVRSTRPSADEVTDPVFEGSAGSFPLAEAGRTRSITLKLTYVKLSLHGPRARAGEYGDAVRRYYEATPGKCPKNCFPQEETEDVNYSLLQWLAYQDLGQTTVERFVRLSDVTELRGP